MTSEVAPPAKRSWGKAILIAIGLLLLVSLPFLPWLSRGLKQGGTRQAVQDAGGRGTYGKQLVETGDYYMDSKDKSKEWIRDLFGEAYADDLTLIEFPKPMPKELVSRLAALPALETLDASGADLNDADVKKLVAANTLKKVWLNGAEGITGAGLEALGQLEGLMSLSLDDTQIDDSALDTVGKMSALKRLYLANTKVTDAGVKKLSGLSGLLGIGLEGTGVGDTCLPELVKLQALKEVRLSGTKVTDAGVAQLAQLPMLKSLSLTNTELTTAGLQWLGKCGNLEILDLAGTQVDDGVVDAIAEIPKLVSVSLRGTAVSDEAIRQLKRRAGRGVTVQWDAGDEVLAK